MRIKSIIAGVYLSLSLASYAYTPVTINFSDGQNEHQVTFKKAPTRAVTSHFMTEMLLSLGLEDRIVGTFNNIVEVAPEYKKAFKKIPVLSDRYPSKEILYSVEPDFISGWNSILDPKRFISVDDFLAYGVTPFIVKSGGRIGKSVKNVSVETVYSDYMVIGKIFDVEERARKIVDSLKIQVNNAKKIRGNKNPVSIFIYDKGKEAPFTLVGSGLGNDIVKKAGGKNIFEDIDGYFATVSWEAVLERDPEFIVVVDYNRHGKLKEKINFLKKNEFTKDLEAVKKNRFVVVTLADLSPGPRVGEAIQNMAEQFFNKGSKG